MIGAGSYDDIRDSMAALEWLAASHLELSLLLMAGLYAAADAIFAHDVADAVELWLENKGTAPLAGYIAIHVNNGSVPPQKGAEWVHDLNTRGS